MFFRLLILFMLPPAAALSCETLLVAAPIGWMDTPVEYGPQCEFTWDSGEGASIKAGPIADFGTSGVVGQRLEIEEINNTSAMLIADCKKADAILLLGKPDEGWQEGDCQPDIHVNNALKPIGAIQLSTRTSVNRLRSMATRYQYAYNDFPLPSLSDYSLPGRDNVLQAIEPKLKIDPSCGCRIHYPDSLGARSGAFAATKKG